MRRQILKEILETEAGFVADLKALRDAFLALMITAPAMNTQTRAKIQQNVGEMIELHEDLVNDFRQISIAGSLREWKNMVSIPRLKWRTNEKLRSLDPPPLCSVKCNDGIRDGVLGFNSSATQRSLSQTADALEAGEVAQAFCRHTPRFAVYEEYSAMYASMSHEVTQFHESVPQWPSYEAGIEALSRTVASLKDRSSASRKALTTADLMVKPIQRVCKYPLLLAELHRYTYAIDCPTSYAEIEAALHDFRDVAGKINAVGNDSEVRDRMQKRWLLQEHLWFRSDRLRLDQFRMLGQIVLCGVLHVAYQTSCRVDGGYMLCVLFREYFLVALHRVEGGKFDPVAMIYLADVKICSPKNGQGVCLGQPRQAGVG